MTIKCAWCGAWMGEKCPECGAEGHFSPTATSGYSESTLSEYVCENYHRWNRGPNVNHGICEDCYEKHSPKKEPKA